jgi:galactokinase
MPQNIKKLKVLAPGRVCLFGEHQDYLGLPVIPCAISLCIEIEGEIRDDLKINIDLPDIKDKESFLIEEEIPYIKERDYFRSGVNIMQRENFTFSRGFNCKVKGEIPISSGVSSSSALAVAWIKFLSKMSDQELDLSSEDIAKYAHRAEVLEFREPGGMMDHFSSALGNVIFVEFHPEIRIEQIQADLKGFVLGDSNQPKDTKRILSEVKNRVIDITKSISKRYPDFNLHDITVESLKKYTPNLNPTEIKLIKGTIRNHEITEEAKEVLKKKPLDHNRIGHLINEHNDILRDILKITTPKIDRMIEASLEAGALGAKITGSGGGGCMFAYCSENQRDILDAIEKEGGKGYIVDMDNGVRLEIL